MVKHRARVINYLTYNWRDSWDWDRIKKIRKKKGIGQTRYDHSDKFYSAIERAVKTRHKTLIHEKIDNYKTDGYTFGVERRKSKTGKIYNGYLYRQKRNVNSKSKEHISLKAKSLDDYRDNVLLKQAKIDVFRDKMGGWVGEGLTPSEIETFNTISNEYRRYRKQDDRNPVIVRYINQLGLKVKNRRYGIIVVTKNMTLQKKKNLLKAAKKALIKQDKAHKKLLKIITLKGDHHSHRAFNDFIKNVVRESKCGSNVKKLQKYISQVISRDDNSTYSILNPSEVRLFAVEILWNNRKSRKLTM